MDQNESTFWLGLMESLAISFFSIFSNFLWCRYIIFYNKSGFSKNHLIIYKEFPQKNTNNSIQKKEIIYTVILKRKTK